MDLKKNHKNEPTDKQNESDKLSDTGFKPKTNEELNEENPSRRNRRPA